MLAAPIADKFVPLLDDDLKELVPSRCHTIKALNVIATIQYFRLCDQRNEANRRLDNLEELLNEVGAV